MNNIFITAKRSKQHWDAYYNGVIEVRPEKAEYLSKPSYWSWLWSTFLRWLFKDYVNY